jgi:hypothetical protein
LKKYPLDPCPIREMQGNDLLGYYSKGHHEPAAFVAAAEEAWGDRCDAAQVRHGWRRVAIGSFDDEWMHWLAVAEAGGRGAFPVTIIEFDP